LRFFTFLNVLSGDFDFDLDSDLIGSGTFGWFVNDFLADSNSGSRSGLIFLNLKNEKENVNTCPK